MNRTFKTVLFTLLVSFFMVSSVDAQKFGYINSQELISQLPEVKEANSKIETLKKQLQKKGQDMIAALQTKYTALQEKQAKGEISRKALEEEAAMLQKEEEGIAKFEQSSQEKIFTKSEQLLAPIQEKINNAIKEVAADNGYDYIFDSSLGMVLYADPAADVSGLVKSKLGLQ